MDIVVGVPAIDQAQAIIHNSGNTIFASFNKVKSGIKILIINTFTDEIVTEIVPNVSIGDEMVTLIKYEIMSFIDAYISSLSDEEVLNIKWACRLNLLKEKPILMYEEIKF